MKSNPIHFDACKCSNYGIMNFIIILYKFLFYFFVIIGTHCHISCCSTPYLCGICCQFLSFASTWSILTRTSTIIGVTRPAAALLMVIARCASTFASGSFIPTSFKYRENVMIDISNCLVGKY